MHWADRRRRFRAVLAGDCCVHPGSVFDPISARIAEDLGFELGMFAGSTASLTVLGAPDLIVLTLSEFAAQAYRINRAGNLPLLVDADHGYAMRSTPSVPSRSSRPRGCVASASRILIFRRHSARPSRASPRSPKASAR